MYDRVIIGHQLTDDFELLDLSPNDFQCQLRDLSIFSQFKSKDQNGLPTRQGDLRELAGQILNADIQNGHHSTIINARVALAIYRTYQQEVEFEMDGRSLYPSCAQGSGEVSMMGQNFFN